MIRKVVHTLRRALVGLLKFRFAHVGEDFAYSPFCSRIRGHRNISIGNRVFIGHGANFSIHKELRIGDDVLMGPDVMILSGSHPIDNIGAPINVFHEGVNGRCVIEEDVWIAARVILIGELTIGEGSVIAAGAVVTRDVPPFTIAGGVPCKPIRRRFTDDELCTHLEKRGYAERYEVIKAARDSAMPPVKDIATD